MENQLDPVIIAAKIRLLPYSMHRRTVCLRLELLGCPFQGLRIGIESRTRVIANRNLIDLLWVLSKQIKSLT